MKRQCPVLLLVCLCWMGMISNSAGAQPADLKLKAQLIWATDEEKPRDQKLNDLDPKLANKLRRFKWKHYWEVTAKETAPVTTRTQRIKMSEKCETELKKVDENTIEVKFYGEGKLVNTSRLPIKSFCQGEYLVIGGDDKEKRDNAWFVVFSVPAP